MKFFASRLFRTGVRMQALAHLFFGDRIGFPEDHHHNVLRIGEIQVRQHGMIELGDLAGGGVQGETELIFELQRVIFLAHDDVPLLM